jgi:hypothetical protein
LREEYENAARMGLHEEELAKLVDMGFEHSFAHQNPSPKP